MTTQHNLDFGKLEIMADERGIFLNAHGATICRIMNSGSNDLEIAHLFANALEVLGALEEVVRVGDDKLAFRSEWVAAVGRAHAAIAKARGKGGAA